MFVSVQLTPWLVGRTTVTLDGVDVTNDCIAADDELGYVLVYKRNEEGERYVAPETGRATWERCLGTVTIEVNAGA